MKNRDPVYVQRIIEYCIKIEDILSGIDYDYDVFITNDIYQLSCSMCVLQIGENVAKLSDEFKEANEGIPWRKIKGLRNIAAHQYEHVEFIVLWNTLVNNIPELKADLIMLMDKQ